MSVCGSLFPMEMNSRLANLEKADAAKHKGRGNFVVVLILIICFPRDVQIILRENLFGRGENWVGRFCGLIELRVLCLLMWALLFAIPLTTRVSFWGW